MLMVNQLVGFSTVVNASGVQISYMSSVVDDADLTTYTFAGVSVPTSGVILVAVGGDRASGSAGSLSSATIDGNAATLVVTSTAGFSVAAIVGLAATGNASVTITVTFSNAMSRAAIAVYGMTGRANATASSTAHNGGSTAGLTGTVNVPANGAALAVAHGVTGVNPGSYVWTNLTEDYDGQHPEITRSVYSGARDSFVAAQTSYGVTATLNEGPSSSYNAIAVAAFGP